MKKNGFTLAEVLITLGIVGVVSALVLPTFTTKMQTAKVGPRLAKSVAAFEQACIAILDDEHADELSATDYTERPDIFLSNALPLHMKGSYDSANQQFVSADGVAYRFVYVQGRHSNNPALSTPGQFTDANGNVPHLAPITSVENGRNCTALEVDIDAGNGPNRAGRDKFFFQMMDDGSLRPWGGSWEEEDLRWTKTCPKASGGNTSAPALCAGHVMENGLKVEYKYSGGDGRLQSPSPLGRDEENNDGDAVDSSNSDTQRIGGSRFENAPSTNNGSERVQDPNVRVGN